MNVGKSIRVAMAMKNMRNSELAEKLGVTQSTVSVMCSRDTAAGQTLKALAEIFEMKVSELLALGED